MACITKVVVSAYCGNCKKTATFEVDIPTHTHTGHINEIAGKAVEAQGWMINIDRAFDRCPDPECAKKHKAAGGIWEACWTKQKTPQSALGVFPILKFLLSLKNPPGLHVVGRAKVLTTRASSVFFTWDQRARAPCWPREQKAGWAVTVCTVVSLRRGYDPYTHASSVMLVTRYQTVITPTTDLPNSGTLIFLGTRHGHTLPSWWDFYY